MFRESLLESSSLQSRKHKRWPMAAAFAGEMIIAGLLILIPLVTTGVIPVSAHVISCPLGSVHVGTKNHQPRSGSGGGGKPAYTVISLGSGRRAITVDNGRNKNSGETPFEITDGLEESNLPLTDGHYTPPVQEKPVRRHIISVLDEARLLNKVEPVYPRIAVLTHRQGDVKLHAFIAKDGTIESLTVVSGDPLLASAAVEAVRQWRYRPYFLNGEPVEVETLITVSFKGIRD